MLMVESGASLCTPAVAVIIAMFSGTWVAGWNIVLRLTSESFRTPAIKLWTGRRITICRLIAVSNSLSEQVGLLKKLVVGRLRRSCLIGFYVNRLAGAASRWA